jgi:hypothetical protein
VSDKDYGDGPVAEDHPHRNRYNAAVDWWITQGEMELSNRVPGDAAVNYPIELQVVHEQRRRTLTAHVSHGETLQIDAERVDRRVCANCQQRFSRSLQACSRCRVVYYCSRDCQQAHWRAHRPNCRSQIDVLRQRHS